jgi:hypothetical protein
VVLIDTISHKYRSKLNSTSTLVPFHQLTYQSHGPLVHQSSFLDVTRLVVGHPLPFRHIPSILHQRRMHHLNHRELMIKSNITKHSIKYVPFPH